ncbi:c-type cytochrome [Salipaludibacillus agaradhaerens]|uniref:C-type cytochrome n=1 Tax=Salipaludibacillus agaradhaerens TaxID=76935 RepID=A0A9Q4AYZ3_SALAG|nr:c-type cytochrome [Salipaludibacillus agaradhaerens]MCR6095120.1 c-type cytochrome [Salipaludibacillus agaradhaerens]MCR6115322.1 c-type cytochrome [Salipaludibacillus agaradhaerens]
MKKWMFAIFGTVLVLSACGGNDTNTNEPAPENNGNNVENTENAADSGEYDLANGEQVYAQNCAACHGGDLTGASGPGLETHTAEAVEAAIQEGPGSMPADLVTGEDAADVAAWIESQ